MKEKHRLSSLSLSFTEKEVGFALYNRKETQYAKHFVPHVLSYNRKPTCSRIVSSIARERWIQHVTTLEGTIYIC